MEEYKSDTGLLVRKIRESMGITMSELADRVDISKNYMNRIERGVNDNISLEIGIKLSKELSKAPCVMNNDIDLNSYNSPLAQMIISEVAKSDNNIKYSSKYEVIKAIVERYPNIKEFEMLLRYTEYMNRMPFIKRQITAFQDYLKMLNKKDKSMVNPCFSEGLSWLLTNTDFGIEFDETVKKLIESGDEQLLVEWLGILIRGLLDYSKLINGDDMMMSFKEINK